MASVNVRDAMRLRPETDHGLTDAFLRVREAFHGAMERDQDGQGMVEYAFILMLVALVLILVVGILGKQVKNVFSNVSTGLGT
jgi:pilus assembly protein Flp/PilA